MAQVGNIVFQSQTQCTESLLVEFNCGVGIVARCPSPVREQLHGHVLDIDNLTSPRVADCKSSNIAKVCWMPEVGVTIDIILVRL